MSRWLWSLTAAIQTPLDGSSMHRVNFDGNLPDSIPLSLCQNPFKHKYDRGECISIPSAFSRCRSMGLGATGRGCAAPPFESRTRNALRVIRSTKICVQQMKTAFQTKISFRVSSAATSRLWLPPEIPHPLDAQVRVAGMWAFVTTSVIGRHRQALPRV